MYTVLKPLVLTWAAFFQKLLRSADHSLPHKYIVVRTQSLLLFTELGFNNKHSFNDLRYNSVYRKEW